MQEFAYAHMHLSPSLELFHDQVTERMPYARLEYCGGLINQRVYIGCDPVGHACMNESAVVIIVRGYLVALCRKCADAIIEGKWDQQHASHSIDLCTPDAAITWQSTTLTPPPSPLPRLVPSQNPAPAV